MSSIPETSGIYKITCIPTKKIYIGSAINLLNRWAVHRYDLRTQTHRNRYLQRAWNKHGEDAFTFDVIELVLSPFLIEREQYWLDKLRAYNPRKGFNLLHTAGSVPEQVWTEEARAKVSARMKAHWADPEARAKQSERSREQWADPDTRAKTTRAHKARWADPAERKKQGAITHQRYIDDPTRGPKHSEQMKAYWGPAERQKRAEQSRAMWADPDLRAKILATRALTHKRKRDKE